MFLPFRVLLCTFLNIFSCLFRSDVTRYGSLFQVRHRDVVLISMVFVRLAAATTQAHSILLSVR
jgi:hypothetical protein